MTQPARSQARTKVTIGGGGRATLREHQTVSAAWHFLTLKVSTHTIRGEPSGAPNFPWSGGASLRPSPAARSQHVGDRSSITGEMSLGEAKASRAQQQDWLVCREEGQPHRRSSQEEPGTPAEIGNPKLAASWLASAIPATRGRYKRPSALVKRRRTSRFPTGDFRIWDLILPAQLPRVNLAKHALGTDLHPWRTSTFANEVVIIS